MAKSNVNCSIPEFYAGKSVFVTGGTGFIGKVLLEKLLYTCIDIDKIYILIRGNENATSEQRLQEIIKNPVFARIRKDSPQSLNKIVAVSGDIADNNLGISSENEQSFVDKVSVVFHSAATVKFNERLDVAANLNWEACKRVLNLCHRMKNLKAPTPFKPEHSKLLGGRKRHGGRTFPDKLFTKNSKTAKVPQSFVHVSTAFIHPQNKHLDEVVYPAPVGARELGIFIAQKGMDDEERLKKFLCGRPNTYTFTKALAENYIAENHGTIPTAIIRPSIVTSSVSDPVAGWIDSWSAGASVVITTSLGYSRVLVGKGSNYFDMIPVDYVANLAIVAGAKNSDNKLKIFNSCTSSCNPISLRDTYKISRNYIVENGINEQPIPFVIITKNTLVKDTAVFFLEKLPAVVIDLYRRFKGQKPRYQKLQQIVANNRKHTKFFTSRTYDMSADSTIALSRSLSERDARLFPINPQDINWKKYLPVYIQGIRKYLLKK